jgi:hypothetical protein
MSELDQQPQSNPPFDPSAFDSLGKRDRLETLRWYLVTIGVIALVLAAICIFMGRNGSTGFFSHKDFALNPIALGRYLLLAGFVSYASGRAITYYRRFSKREPV